MNKPFMKQEYLDQLTDIFKNYCPNATILAYGSRINDDFHSGSDLDLTVKDFGDDNCNIGELRNILTNSNIPFLIDISMFNDLPESFRENILKKHIVIYPLSDI